MKKPATNNYPILEVLKQRWSPRAYSDKPVEIEKIKSIFEAARWAPSSRNEQPWRFIVGQKGDETWESIFDILDPWNQKWAFMVPVLVLNIANKFSDYKHLKNDKYQYDTGQAVAMMVTEAVNQGLYGHQMGGFNPQKAIEVFNIHEDYEPLSVSAFGYYGNPGLLPNDMHESEMEERTRRPLKETVFVDVFGKNSSLFD